MGEPFPYPQPKKIEKFSCSMSLIEIYKLIDGIMDSYKVSWNEEYEAAKFGLNDHLIDAVELCELLLFLT